MGDWYGVRQKRWTALVAVIAGACALGYALHLDPSRVVLATLAFISTLAAYVSTEVTDYRQTATKESDRKTLVAFQHDFPADGFVSVLADHEFNIPIDLDDISKLGRLCEKWGKPDQFFLDRRLDKARVHFLKTAENFLMAAGQHLDAEPAAKGEPWRTRVPVELKVRNHKRYYEVLTFMNDVGREVASSRTMLINVARRVLRL